MQFINLTDSPLQFQKLKLSGFKSFVDATEFVIEPGLTGIVGPNGCGKSNLLEALRWVMGATSAKALRGSEMDDVIFAGSDKRTSRTWAEVSLSIDNSQRLAPQPFTDQPVLDIARRIHRGEGSNYRINGREVRAKDVQLLFADASTGANSPALVRQGQISELIAAKPQNRRRVLEEAAGVSGLHTRRHEAELRLGSAEQNLNRLDDIAVELDAMLAKLRKEARQAEKYRKISAEIRALQKVILYARWLDTVKILQDAKSQLQILEQKVMDCTRYAAIAQTKLLESNEHLIPLREEEAVAVAVLNQILIHKERIDLEEKQTLDEVKRLGQELLRIKNDTERESSMLNDGQLQTDRLNSALKRLRDEIAGAPSKEPQLRAEYEAKDNKRAEAEKQVEALAVRQAALLERQKSEKNRLTEAMSRLERLTQQLAKTQQDQAFIGDFDYDSLKLLEAEVIESQSDLENARTRLEHYEALRPEFVAKEARARKTLRETEDSIGRLEAEARGIKQILASNRKEGQPVLDQIKVIRGYELALAAALGDDLNLGLSKRDSSQALAFWCEDFREQVECEITQLTALIPLSTFIESMPDALRRRFAAVFVVDRANGDELHGQLPVGARMVSKEGDLWRWDGVIVRARAPKPAAIRLTQRNRLNEIDTECASLIPILDEAKAAQAKADTEQKVLELQILEARAQIPKLENSVRTKQARWDAKRREEAQYSVRLEGLLQSLERLQDEQAEAQTQFHTIESAQAKPLDEQAMLEEMSKLRKAAETCRLEVLKAKQQLDEELRERQNRESRERTLSRELKDWQGRTYDAKTRFSQLAQQEKNANSALGAALSKAPQFEITRLKLVDDINLAQRRVHLAKDALAQHSSAVKDAEIDTRGLEKEASLAREERAGAQARVEALMARLEDAKTQIFEQTQETPEILGQKLKDEVIAIPADPGGAESLLAGLIRERDNIGPVNLRAEDESTEYEARLEALSAERNDLLSAIAKLRAGIDTLNSEGRERLLKAFEVINGHFQALFVALFDGGTAELRLVESDDPLEAGLEIFACPPGKRLASMSLMSGGEQALTATALIFGVFLANPAPVCVLDEVDAPLDDANVDRYCRLLNEMRRHTKTRFIVITHNPVTMSRMDRLFGVTMAERGVSQLVSVDLNQAEAMVTENVA